MGALDHKAFYCVNLGAVRYLRTRNPADALARPGDRIVLCEACLTADGLAPDHPGVRLYRQPRDCNRLRPVCGYCGRVREEPKRNFLKEVWSKITGS